MKKTYIKIWALSLAVANITGFSIVAEEPVDAAAEAKAAAAAERARLKFVNKKNIELMTMLTLLADRPKELGMFADVMKAASEANQLRLDTTMSAEEFAQRSQQAAEKMQGFFKLLKTVRANSIIEESLKNSPLVPLDEQGLYEGEIPFLLSVLEIAEAEQERRLKEALENAEKFRKILHEVAAVYTSLMVNMSPTMRKALAEHMKKGDA